MPAKKPATAQPTPSAPVCYLVHFETPYRARTGTQQATCQHYIGYTTNLSRREARHREGRGARLLRACNETGVKWNIVRTWPEGSLDLERALKNRRAKVLCPCCNPDAHRVTVTPKKRKVTEEMKQINARQARVLAEEIAAMRAAQQAQADTQKQAAELAATVLEVAAAALRASVASR